MLNLNQKICITFSCSILAVGLLSIDLTNPSLPYIMRSLKISEMATKFLMASYMLGLGSSQFFYGTFSDNHGRKKTILLSNIISLIGIMLCILSNSIAMLYIGRFINGVGSGGSAVIARAIIADVCYIPSHLKQAFSYFTIFGVLSPAIAPVIGGFVQCTYNNWKYSFFILFVITLISSVIFHVYLPETHMIPLSKTPKLEQVKRYVSLLRSRRFMVYNFVSSIIYIFSISYYAYMPFILFKLHFSAVKNGYLYSIYAISLLFGSLSLAKFFRNSSYVKTFILSCTGLLILSLGFFIYFMSHYSKIILILFTTCISFLCGIVAPLTLSLCMQGFSSENRGAASAVQSFIKMFFTGIALLFINLIPMYSLMNLLACYIFLSLILMGLYMFDRFYLKA